MKKVLLFALVVFFAAAFPAAAFDCPVADGNDAVFRFLPQELEGMGFELDKPMYVVHRGNGWLLFKNNQTAIPPAVLERSKVIVGKADGGAVTLRIPNVGANVFDIVQFPDPGNLEDRNYLIKEAGFNIAGIPNQGIKKSPCINNDGTGPGFSVKPVAAKQ